MAMIEMQPERLGIKLVSEVASGLDKSARTCAGHTVHFAGVEAVKVHGVWMVTSIAELDANAVAFRGSQCGAGNPAVIGPGGKFNARKNFNIFIEGNDLVFPQGLSIW